MIRKKKYIIFILVTIIIFFLAVFYLVETNKRIKSGTRRKMPDFTEKKASSGSVVDNPEDYGIIITYEDDKPTTEEEWEKVLNKKMKGLKSQYSSEAWNKIGAEVKKSQIKTEEKIEKINKRIREYREILRESPDNKKVRERLDRLILLKAIVEQFPH